MPAFKPLELDQGGQKQGNAHPAKQADNDMLIPNFVFGSVPAQGREKQCRHQQDGHSPGRPAAVSIGVPQGDQGGGQGCEDIHTAVVGHFCGPQQLKTGHPRDKRNQDSQSDGGQKEQRRQKGRAQTQAYDDPCCQLTHLQTAGPGSDRPRWPGGAPPWRSRATVHR